ncbi:MAG: glycosyltransferase family 2 protein [Chitinophagaceae bacterium]|nr:glycosyltransferase family 2 protein [Chitinophagaceae bacterium]
MPLVSVIIPCYNDGQYLDESVGSVKQQTFGDTEIIIVNDGSTDAATIQKLGSFNDPQITVLHKENGHLSSARNHGIRHAKGEIIVTLDADDRFEPAFIKQGVTVLKQDASVGAVTCYLKGYGLKKFSWKPLGGDIKNFLFRQESCASAMFRKECWEKTGGYDEQMKSGYEDWEFWIRLTAAGWKVHVLKDYLLHYRVTEKSMLLTQSEPRREAIVNYIMEKHKGLYWEQLKDAVIQRKIIDLRNPESTTVLLKNLYWRLTGKKK